MLNQNAHFLEEFVCFCSMQSAVSYDAYSRTISHMHRIQYRIFICIASLDDLQKMVCSLEPFLYKKRTITAYGSILYDGLRFMRCLTRFFSLRRRVMIPPTHISIVGTSF